MLAHSPPVVSIFFTSSIFIVAPFIGHDPDSHSSRQTLPEPVHPDCNRSRVRYRPAPTLPDRINYGSHAFWWRSTASEHHTATADYTTSVSMSRRRRVSYSTSSRIEPNKAFRPLLSAYFPHLATEARVGDRARRPRTPLALDLTLMKHTATLNACPPPPGRIGKGRFAIVTQCVDRRCRHRLALESVAGFSATTDCKSAADRHAPAVAPQTVRIRRYHLSS